MAPQDTFIDEDDDCCPLCVEEFDLSDMNFKPCPCGYKICQFCFNNIKNNINGLCPACRRPYDDKTIEWKVVTPEEIAQFKANIQKNAKKKADQRQKEAQKREVENLNRKHLAGLRVVQPNLVYVVGLSPGMREEEALQTLRGDKYFGQYGKILKIVVSNKAKGSDGGPNASSQGVYVTFARKDDAARCIAAVNGSQNGDRVLRAQFGTTKYCSAYLRNETCTNKQCMFLHEAGDNDDSYSRQDLSSINSISSQRPLTSMGSSSGSSSRQASQSQAPIQYAQPIAAAAHPMTREDSNHASDSGDGSALPSTASWAKQRSRRGSHSTSGAASSPAVSQSVPVPAEATETLPEAPRSEQKSEIAVPATNPDSESSIPPRPARDPILVDLLKLINLSEFTIPSTNEDSESNSYPPLFDPNGGEKRRAVREQQEEDRLHMEHESQTDQNSVTEPLDDEEPDSGISGSLQLGGEPEDGGREAPQGFQRRQSAQHPIQRGSSGVFGPGLSQTFPQNLTSINGRTLTPVQQSKLALFKPGQSQSSFMDQYPPGMGNFQQPGHNRQSSRYNFASEGSSSSASVKPSANPKFLAQQASMMPSNHLQQAGQFYGSSIPGPPPGLKSSGTPPISTMFGQQGFGLSMGGNSVFNTKENNSELLRDAMRGRGLTGGSQGHDKRELFPSFLQQYPSASSTPAPASGLLASLYGPQTGAFHDFGQKQKKKGKKHRHANTSSSGGGGLVDLADPSILQARMHQQQSNAGVGQVLYGGQTPDDMECMSPLDVDALVSDDNNVGIHGISTSAFASRSSTPSVPPGFGFPHAYPELVTREDPIPKPVSRIAPTAAPFTPSRNPLNLPGVAAPLANVALPLTPTKPSKAPETPMSQAKLDVKSLAITTGLSKAISSQSSIAPPGILQAEEFPALDSGKAKSTFASTKSVPVKPATAALSKKQVPAIVSKDKRSTPGVLSIKPPSKPSGVLETSASPSASSSFPPLPPSTPSTSVNIASQRPAVVTSKALKYPPRTETPTTGTTPSCATSVLPPNYQASRHPGLASAVKNERSATPTSEIISDNASITSTSMSRANSPPPSKIGSAPIRMTTKSMQKKQRREAQREKEKQELEASSAPKSEQEPEIAPIMGRKKKQKKDKTVSSAAGGSTPAVSRPPSPWPAVDHAIEESRADSTEQESRDTEESTVNAKKILESKGKGKVKPPQRPATPESAPISAVEAPVEEEATNEKSIPTPASTLQHLYSEGAIADINTTFLKALNGMGSRHPEATHIDIQNPLPKLSTTVEEKASLLSGKPIRKVIGPQRVLLTPHGDCLRNLTAQEEERFLALQSALTQAASNPTVFTSGRGYFIGGQAVAPLTSELGAWETWEHDSSLGSSEESAHFGISRDTGHSLGMSLPSLEDVEATMQRARKDTEVFEKRLNNLLKKNRKLLLGSGH